MQNEEELRRILAGLQEQQRPVPIWQRIAEAVARGIGTAGSPSPGGALLNQLEEMGAERRRKEDREQAIKNVGVQFQLQDLANRMSEGRTIAAEQRSEEAKKREEQRANDEYVRRFGIESGFREKMSDKEFRQTTQLAFLKNGFDKDMADLGYQHQTNLEKLRSSNNITERSIAEQLNVIVPLMYSGVVDPKQAQSIYEKIKNGDTKSLTKEENAALAKADKYLRDEKYRQELKQRYASHEGGASMVQKMNEWALGRAAATDLGMDDQGGIHELTVNPLTMKKEGPPGVKIVKYLNEDEQVDYYRDRSGIKGFATPKEKETLQAAEVSKVNHYTEVIGNLKDKEKKTDEQIRNILNNIAQSVPGDADAIQKALSSSIKQGAVAQKKTELDTANEEFQRLNKESPYTETPEKSKARGRAITIAVKAQELEKARKGVRDLEATVAKAEDQIQKYGDKSMLGSSPSQRKKALENAKERLDYAKRVLAEMEKQAK